MTFELVFSQEALTEMGKVDNDTAKRILDKLEEAAAKPTHYFKRLVGREEFKIRIGDYRIIARIFISESKIFILTLGHRKNIYKK